VDTIKATKAALLEEESALASEEKEYNNHRRQSFRDKRSTSPVNDIPTTRIALIFEKPQWGIVGAM